MKTHNLKLNEVFCDDVLDGTDKFLIYKNDSDFQVGDLIKFAPTSEHKISNHTFEITKIEHTFIGRELRKGYVALSIEEVVHTHK